MRCYDLESSFTDQFFDRLACSHTLSACPLHISRMKSQLENAENKLPRLLELVDSWVLFCLFPLNTRIENRFDLYLFRQNHSLVGSSTLPSSPSYLFVASPFAVNGIDERIRQTKMGDCESFFFALYLITHWMHRREMISRVIIERTSGYERRREEPASAKNRRLCLRRLNSKFFRNYSNSPLELYSLRSW